jgi:outer membrane receptor for ferrienterochelin and colicins
VKAAHRRGPTLHDDNPRVPRRPLLNSIACAGLLLAATAAAAQSTPSAPSPPPPAASAPERIEVTGGRASDTEQRRQSTAAKIVIGRDEIEKFGDSTVGEVLRRLPGVTTPGAPGRGGPPRLRGLGGGYTQMLIDGQRLPPGFSIESLTPEQIERIEILRAPTAETGARAIAGTINIVTREGFRRRLNDVRLGLAVENGEPAKSASWTHNDSDGPLSYNLSASAFDNRRRTEGTTDTTETALADGSVLEAQRETAQSLDRRKGLNLTGRLQWRLSESGDSLLLTPNFVHTEAHGDRSFQLVPLPSAPAGVPLPYDSGSTVSDSRYSVGRLNGQWRQRLDSGARLELNGGFGGWRARSDSLRQEYGAGSPVPLRTVQDNNRTDERSGTLSVKLSRLVGGSDAEPDRAHNLVGGFELEAIRREEVRSGDSTAESDGDNLQAASQRLAAYAQDEWALTPTWAVHAGLRWEGITTTGEATDGTQPTNRSSVLTPLLHLLWKPEPKSRDQVRLSLTRSYRSPALGTLIGQTTINSKSDPSGPNDPTSPDRAGNPALQPELATGLDLAVERYLSGGGVLSANLFHRRISQLMRSVVTLEDVPYSPVPRYVARQQNVGDATTQGLELEAKFPLDQALAGAPRVELRSNLSLYRSSVDGVPGPDNRLDQQAPATANLGADYRWRGTPLSLGGNLNWVAGYETQLSETQRVSTGAKQVFDLYALWTFNPAVALRLTGSNLGARDYETSNTISTASSRETARSFGPSYAQWLLRLELRL